MIVGDSPYISSVVCDTLTIRIDVAVNGWVTASINYTPRQERRA
jgi:hypothetical protein